MTRTLRCLLFLLLFASPALAQTGGTVSVKAIDTATGATTDVGDNTNHAIRVNVVAGSSGNAAASATGSAVPASADYQGINVGGTLRGATGVNPSGVVYATQMDITSVGGTTVVNGGTAGVISVGGSVASGGTNAANPLKMGGVFNTTQPTVTNGQIVDFQATARGAQIVAVGADAFTVQPGNTANTTPWLVSQKPMDACGTTVNDFVAQLTATTLTTVTSTTQCVDTITLANIGSSVTTVLGQDVSTACNSGVCSLFPTTPLAPNAVMTLSLGGLKMTGGIKLQANNANAIQYFIHSRQ